MVGMGGGTQRMWCVEHWQYWKQGFERQGRCHKWQVWLSLDLTQAVSNSGSISNSNSDLRREEVEDEWVRGR
jgi:hypothetical protein